MSAWPRGHGRLRYTAGFVQTEKESSQSVSEALIPSPTLSALEDSPEPDLAEQRQDALRLRVGQ